MPVGIFCQFCHGDIPSTSKQTSRKICKKQDVTPKSSNNPTRHLNRPTERQQTKKTFLLKKRQQERNIQQSWQEIRDEKQDYNFVIPELEPCTDQILNEPQSVYYARFAIERGIELSKHDLEMNKADIKDYERTLSKLEKRKICSREPIYFCQINTNKVWKQFFKFR